MITYADEDVTNEIIHRNDASSPIVLSFDWPHRINFHLPAKFDASIENWTAGDCSYHVLTNGFRFNSSANANVYDFLIEQRCEKDPNIVRYEFSDFYGLQSFAIGDIALNDSKKDFQYHDVYSLYGSKFGFGSKVID